MIKVSTWRWNESAVFTCLLINDGTQPRAQGLDSQPDPFLVLPHGPLGLLKSLHCKHAQVLELRGGENNDPRTQKGALHLEGWGKVKKCPRKKKNGTKGNWCGHMESLGSVTCEDVWGLLVPVTVATASPNRYLFPHNICDNLNRGHLYLIGYCYLDSNC